MRTRAPIFIRFAMISHAGVSWRPLREREYLVSGNPEGEGNLAQVKLGAVRKRSGAVLTHLQKLIRAAMQPEV
jgi:hypothetical protein